MLALPSRELADPVLRSSPLFEALDGYPVEALADLYRVSDDPGHALALADRLMTAWIARLTHDIDRVQLPAPDGIVRARQRMIDTRDALRRVQARFALLATRTPAPALH